MDFIVWIKTCNKCSLDHFGGIRNKGVATITSAVSPRGKRMSNVVVHMELCFWPTHTCSNNISLFALFFNLYQHRREMFDS